MYLTATRPDLMYSVCLISRYMANPIEEHLLAAKRVLRYLKGTLELGMFYAREGAIELFAYTDNDYVDDYDDRKSTSGYVFKLSREVVAWASKKQPIVNLSTTEAEYIVAASCVCHSIWMKRVFNHFSPSQSKCIIVFCDNPSTIKLSKNLILHGRSKYIDVRFHFLCTLTMDGVVELKYCGTSEQLADIMTKSLKLKNFVKLQELLGMKFLVEVN